MPHCVKQAMRCCLSTHRSFQHLVTAAALLLTGLYFNLAAQGESLPFRHTVHQLMEKLAAAGVGQRPVIFVCHR